MCDVFFVYFFSCTPFALICVESSRLTGRTTPHIQKRNRYISSYIYNLYIYIFIELSWYNRHGCLGVKINYISIGKTFFNLAWHYLWQRREANHAVQNSLLIELDTSLDCFPSLCSTALFQFTRLTAFTVLVTRNVSPLSIGYFCLIVIYIYIYIYTSCFWTIKR